MPLFKRKSKQDSKPVDVQQESLSSHSKPAEADKLSPAVAKDDSKAGLTSHTKPAGTDQPSSAAAKEDSDAGPVEMEGDAPAPLPDKEVVAESKYPTEKIPSETSKPDLIVTSPKEKVPLDNKDEVVHSPDSESGTLPPAYGEGTMSSTGTWMSTATKSTGLTSISSAGEIGPDVNPVTHKTAAPDDGMEVYVPESSANAKRQSVPASRQVSLSYREYPFYYSSALTHLIICSPDHQALYFAEVSPFAKNMPDVCVRDILGGGFDDLARKGQSLGLKEAQTAPIVGVADSMPNSKHIKLGLGDPLQPESQKWTLMKCVHEDLKAGSEKYDIVFSHPGEKDVNYLWVRGAAQDGETSSKADSKDSWKMLSDGGVVASFRNASVASIRKRGALRLYDVPGLDDIMLFIFLGCAALCERQRRRKVKKGLLLGL